MRIRATNFARSAVTTAALAVALSACQDSVAGPQLEMAADNGGEPTLRLSTDYADEGAIIEVEYTVPVDSRGNSVLTRGTLTWDASRFEYQDTDLARGDGSVVVARGDGWLMFDMATPLALYEAELTFRFRALTDGDTDGFRLEAVGLSDWSST